MPQRRQLSVSRSNLFWLAIVILAAVIGALIGGWKLSLALAVIALLASEVVERATRARGDSAPGVGAEHGSRGPGDDS